MLLGGRIRARWIVVGTLVLTMLYPISEFYRQEILEGFKRSAVEALTDTTHTLGAMSDFFSSSRAGLYLSEGLAATAGRMDNLGIESVIVRDTPSVSPFQQGGTLVLFPMAFVPRLLWPDKPNIAIGQWITDTYGSGSHIQSNTGPSFIGDLYLNFGVFSVVIGMLVVGAVLRLFQTHFLGPNPTTIGILAAIVVIVQFHIKQVGSASYVLASTVFALAPVLIVYLAVGYLVRGQPSASRPAEMEPDGSGEGYRF
jgi:hypothetical protein